jgi:hypothetical protein
MVAGQRVTGGLSGIGGSSSSTVSGSASVGALAEHRRAAAAGPPEDSREQPIAGGRHRSTLSRGESLTKMLREATQAR